MVLLVGPEEYRFDVHKGILCRASPFFKAAFDSGFTEASGTVRLPEQEVATFKYLIHWIYTCRLRGFYYPDTRTPSLFQTQLDAQKEAKKLGLDKPEDLPWDNPFRKRWDLVNYQDVPLMSLVKLYILADALQVRGLQDHIISTTEEVYYPESLISVFWQQDEDLSHGLESPVASINLAWAMTLDESHLRALFIAMVSCMVRDITKPPYDDTLNADFIKQAFNMTARWWRETKKELEDGTINHDEYNICNYHKHDAGCPKHTNFPIYSE